MTLSDTSASASQKSDAVMDAENLLFGFIRNVNEIIFIANSDREIVEASDTARKIFGIPEKQTKIRIEDYLPKVYIDIISQRIKSDDAGQMRLTFPARSADGKEITLEARFNWFRCGNENLLSITCRDINEFMKTMSDLTEREDRYRTIFRESPIGFIHVNSDGFITDCNNAFLRILGLERFEATGVCLAEDNNLDIYPLFKKSAMDAIVGISSKHESRFCTNNGNNSGWVRVSFSPVISENRAFLGAVGIVEDITEAKNAVDKISFVSSHDTLTGLLNRHACEDSYRVVDMEEYLPLGVIYADLNCLKLANDAFGHPEGDALLKAAAEILKENAGKNGEVYRLGGDEFIIFLMNTGTGGVDERVKRIDSACREWKGGGLVPPSMALGSSVKLRGDRKLHDIMKEAEDLMYANKMRNGKATRTRILGELENRLYEMCGGSVGRRARRMMAWGDWFLENIGGCDREILRQLCRYHDVGLLANPEELPLISGGSPVQAAADPLQHMAVGYRIARCTAEISSSAEYILSHHEWWNGMGYPNQQKGEEIPFASRVVSIFDLMEGMMSMNIGNKFTLTQTLDAVESRAGKQFDPSLAEKIVSLARKSPPKFLEEPRC
ncbi:MAG: diguanylate cyclase [Synergistaceae bacterium]|jgi:diguanylate cyclase (GGDEF)-like protein/PAS domain S-box-containing protein|nr:diguanylate cyclase [Synergistaceae bacterium]